jgi:hypothetical protein
MATKSQCRLEYYQPPRWHLFLISSRNFKNYFMGNLLYVIAVILVIGWLLGAFVFNVGGGLIHILLVIAVVAVLLQLIRGGRSSV